MQRSSIVLTRQHIGRIASFVGVAALIFGVIAFIWQGALTPSVGVTLGIAIVGIALWALMTPHDFRNFVSGKRAQRGTVAVFSTLLLLGITALVYLLLQRAALTLDMTLAEDFTLSRESQVVLRRVARPMRITAFYTSEALPNQEIDDQFFRLYEADTNGLISRQYINPDEQPALAQRYGVTENGQIFLSYVNADGSTDLTTLSRVPRNSDSQERDMTQAVARLLIAGTLTVYFDEGLGERSITDDTQEGISGINNGVRESGLITYALDIPTLAAQNGNIPADAAAVVLARPTTDLLEPEIAVLQRYLDRGGSLLILADVTFNDDPFLVQDGAFSNFLWNNFGLRALDAAVVDPLVSAQTALDILSAYTFADTDIGARLDPAQNPTLFRVARAVQVNLENAPPNIANGQVILSSEQSFGETNLTTLGETNTYQYDAGTDLPGPLATVAWATNLTNEAKIVLIGDSDFVTNGLVMTGGNGVLFTDSMTWLTGMSESISFSPQMFGVNLPLIFVSPQTLNLITFLTIILLPGAVLVAGLAIWLRRARR